MPAVIKSYVRYVDTFNRRVGRIIMYMIFALIGILLYSSISKTFFMPSLWTLEMAQFFMVGYYMLGGAYSLQLATHVRMDLLYGSWSEKKQLAVDCITIFCLIFYLGMMLYGGFSSTEYAIQYGERSYSSWRPYMAPIKIIMCIGILMMLLQAFSELFKDVARLQGEEL